MNAGMEIICVGNELLIGKTLNTNAHWLARRSTSLALTVKRMTVVGDDVPEIADAVREALSRKPRFIITTGGLGPTFDDKTLEGIAEGIGRRLEVNEKALKMIKEKYEIFLKKGRIEKIELTPPRVKMARLPESTEPLCNPVGTAPAMMAEVGQTLLVALPGVPPEMEAIFDESIAPLMKREAGGSAFYETSIYADHIMESILAPLIDYAMHDNPCIYIKSHVYVRSHKTSEGQRPHIELHFSTTSKNPEEAKNRLTTAITQLTELIQKNGGKVKTPATVDKKK